MRRAFFAFAILLATGTLRAESRDWAGLTFGPDVKGAASSGPVTTGDLLRLRIIGGMAVSPDGRWLAFSVYQGIPERNQYVLRWFVQSTDGRSEPQPIDQDGGQPIPSFAYGLPHAFVPRDAPKWSPDSRHISFRRLDGHRIELWIADAATRRSTRVYDGRVQVAAHGWTSAGTLAFRTGLDYAAYQSNLADEAGHGWLLDSRMKLTASRARPNQPACTGGATTNEAPAIANDPACDIRTYIHDPKAGSVAPTEDASALGPPEGRLRARLAGGPTVWLENDEPKSTGFRPMRRLVTDAPRWPRCDQRACRGQFFKELGWARDGASIWFLKAESSLGREDGAPRDETALYEWSSTMDGPRQVLRTEDLLEDCQVRGAIAYCIRETTTRPNHVVSIDVATGAVAVLADPNPAFRVKSFPRVRKVRLEDNLGNPGFAHLVYPYGHEPGKRYPLVITQYSSKGFLRAQGGYEYPTYAFAREGFFVLSVDYPEAWAAQQTMSIREYEVWRYEDDLRNRRAIFAAIERAMDELIAEGMVDAGKIAITGLSAGAEIVHYALQRHSSRFAAAIASSGIHDETFLAFVPAGPRRTRLMEAFKARSLLPGADNAIAKLSWSRMPERLRTPLLINVGEHEALIGFEGIAALKHEQRPVEVRVFPDELHVKYHPRNLAGVYDNNLMWLRFWLSDRKDDRPAFRSQYLRWEEMRKRLQAEN